MPASDAYTNAVVSASVKLKVLVSLLLATMFALFAGQALKSLDDVDRAINQRVAVNRLNGN
jgi:hypothetical protein